MPKPLPTDERVAVDLVAKTLGATFTAFDDNTEPGQADGLFTMPDGTLGALEVTTLADQNAMESDAIMYKTDWSVAGSTEAWLVRVPQSISFQELRQHLSAVVMLCEEHGARSPADLPLELLMEDRSVRWAQRNDVRVDSTGASTTPAVHVYAHGSGGYMLDTFDPLNPWITEQLRRPLLEAKMAKLRRTGRHELHLWLWVYPSGMPFELFGALLGGVQVPSGDGFEPPAGLTGLWLAGNWKRPLLRWSAAGGWKRDDVDVD